MNRLPITLLVLLLGLSGCASQPDQNGMQSRTFSPKHLAKSSMDRVADTIWQDSFEGLLKLADKLYRRNPAEWRKAGVQGRDDALAMLRQRYKSPALANLHEGSVVLLAFSENYRGDRVAVFVGGLIEMLDAAYEHKNDFYMLDSLNPQKIYNFARNLEIAAWKLNQATQDNGQPWLLANETSGPIRNLSFEREFGRLIGLLDLHSQLLSDSSGRTVTQATQSVATAVFLPIGLLKGF